ncbi:hypothetical protein DAPPUDRAFT_344792 [Daphnia pulex]|uniref:Uncharacterized protein n=1 Tax=Daphnia pulex TaxID=6669 RepID=E9I732_DAPPU|nr:hypothetical protein DAPPUDRAFT_344792 [Daphnia pulex]|eukprot:EFX60198.1 hypothetical protein DAPPUDRAFT_344792 [Daphnia pulex]
MDSSRLAGVSRTCIPESPLLIEARCCRLLSAHLHSRTLKSATLKPVETPVGLINPDQCRPCDKGKPLERVGRKAKGPNEGHMFQGQPSRHNAVLFQRHWRAGCLSEQCSPHRLQGSDLGTGLGGAL